MRAGRLDTRAQLLSPAGSVLGSHFINVSDDDGGDYRPGLLQQSATVRGRWLAAVFPGCFWQVSDTRFYLVGAVSNPDGKRLDLLARAVLVTGAVAVVDPDGAARPVLCALHEYQAMPGGEYELLPGGGVRRQAEFCAFQGPPVVGDEFVVAGARFRVLQADPDRSTSVFVRVWIEFLSYV